MDHGQLGNGGAWHRSGSNDLPLELRRIVWAALTGAGVSDAIQSSSHHKIVGTTLGCWADQVKTVMGRRLPKEAAEAEDDGG